MGVHLEGDAVHHAGDGLWVGHLPRRGAFAQVRRQEAARVRLVEGRAKVTAGGAEAVGDALAPLDLTALKRLGQLVRGMVPLLQVDVAWNVRGEVCPNPDLPCVGVLAGNAGLLEGDARLVHCGQEGRRARCEQPWQ